MLPHLPLDLERMRSTPFILYARQYSRHSVTNVIKPNWTRNVGCAVEGG